jgi:hypothetical protein
MTGREQWPWSSYRSYCGGEAGRVQADLAWTMQWYPTNPGLKSETWATHLGSEADKKKL